MGSLESMSRVISGGRLSIPLVDRSSSCLEFPFVPSFSMPDSMSMVTRDEGEEEMKALGLRTKNLLSADGQGVHGWIGTNHYFKAAFGTRESNGMRVGME